MAISVKLEAFEGPLDLLLHLIDKNKIDIYDIPIAEITDQYMEYVNSMHNEDMNVMSEFMVMAATLLDIKCRMLLPRQTDEEGNEEDPRDELVQRLLEYKMCKYMSVQLRTKSVEASRSVYRRQQIPDRVRNYVPPVDYGQLLGDITPGQLQNVFRDVLKRKKYRVDPVRSSFGRIEKEEVDMSGKAAYIRDYLNQHHKTDFYSLLEKQGSRSEVTAAFLIILELMKTGYIRIIQSQQFGEIDIEVLKEIGTDESLIMNLDD